MDYVSLHLLDSRKGFLAFLVYFLDGQEIAFPTRVASAVRRLSLQITPALLVLLTRQVYELRWCSLS